MAVIVLSEGSNIDLDNVINYSKEKLANYKVPKHIEVISNLPRNTMSKVQKKVLRNSYKDIF